MITYYGYTISPNQLETGEGFLICRNVPLARTGDQEYLGSELGLSGEDAGKVITVHRPEAEVFSAEALASFEGKPVTNDHPPDLLTRDDVGMYEKGHVQNVRRGTGEFSDFMLGDLHIHDGMLIDAVNSGKREISCGYLCDYTDDGDGSFTQTNIRGNHVAVVEAARAGKRAAIRDSNKTLEQEAPERNKGSMKSELLKLFGLAVKDRTPEEIAKMAMDTVNVFDADPEAEEQGKAKVVEAEETDGTCGMDSAFAVNILKTMQPALANLKDEKERKALSEALINCVTGDSAKDIAKIVEATQKNAKAAEKAKTVDLDALQEKSSPKLCVN